MGGGFIISCLVQFFSLTLFYARPECGKALRTGRLATQARVSVVNTWKKSHYLCVIVKPNNVKPVRQWLCTYENFASWSWTLFPVPSYKLRILRYDFYDWCVFAYSSMEQICNTVEPVFSGHPRGMAKWPLNTGCTNYRSNTVKMPVCITVNDIVYCLCIKAFKNSLTRLKLTAKITWFEENWKLLTKQ